LVDRYAIRFGDLVDEPLAGGEIWDRFSVRGLFGR